MIAKEIARIVIESLPENASIDDIMRTLYIRIELERAEQSIEEGRGISHAKAKQRL